MIIVFLFLSFATFAGESELEAECNKGQGLSCAKLAYQLRKKGDIARAFEFYDKGCKLNDQTSCTNRSSLNPRDMYFDKLHGIMKFNHQKFIDCKFGTVGKGRKEKWDKVFVQTHINSKGVADLVNIKSELGKPYEECTKKVVKDIKFPPPPGIDPTFDYELTIESN